jgi:two-component system, LytTR family, response regulator
MISSAIRAVIVDDEPPARKKIRRFLSAEPRVEIVGEAGDGAEALEVIQSMRPDLLFLDIQMPVLNGFDVLQALPPPRPRIIFTTAYDQYALQAFEVRALDYLLKPFDEDRFREAMARVLDADRNESDTTHRRLEDLLSEWHSSHPAFLERLLVRSGDRLEIVKIREVLWIQAEEKYVWLYLRSGKFLHRISLTALERRLDPAQFRRIHRSTIVRLDFLRSLIPWTHGDYLVELQDGTRLPLGRSYRESFLAVFPH